MIKRKIFEEYGVQGRSYPATVADYPLQVDEGRIGKPYIAYSSIVMVNRQSIIIPDILNDRVVNHILINRFRPCGLQAHHAPKFGDSIGLELDFVYRSLFADIEYVATTDIAGKMYIFKLDQSYGSFHVKGRLHFDSCLRPEARFGYQGYATIQGKTLHGIGHAPLQRNDTSIKHRIQGVLQDLRIGTPS